VSAKKKGHQNIVERIKAEKYDYIPTKFNGMVYDMCSLSNEFIVATLGKRIVIYDQNFQVLKQTEKLNGKGFFSGSLTLDNESFLYIVDCMHHKIIKTDLDFKALVVVGANKEFDRPCGICAQRDSIYVCDYTNKRIQKLKKSLHLVDMHQLDFEPWYIKANSYTLCVTSTLFEIFFFDLETFRLKNKYDGHNGLIGRINSNFYEFFALDKIIYCYDSNGSLTEEIQINTDLQIDAKYGGGMGYFKGKLLFRSGYDRIVSI
jgi:hypothetical protein